jgi:hypothetical protein
MRLIGLAVYRIGILSGGLPDKNSAHINAFRQGPAGRGMARRAGLFVIEWRSSEGRTDLLTPLAAELVQLKVDVIATAASTFCFGPIGSSQALQGSA